VGDECVGCGTCADGVCFADAIVLEGEQAAIGDACRACGRCVEICPQGAINLSLEHPQVVEESVSQISPLVQVS
ncbi:MAG: hypothetical protein GWN58_43095, partial [Anaerolineae bacterium]|nr:hypothetical protein [Anaerolineae bacterium]